MNEIESIFCKLLRCDRASLYADRHRSFLSPRQEHALEDILKRRVTGEPLQYLLGDTEFMGLKIRVRRGVLIPRPETEILVEEALAVMNAGPRSLRVLDIGTGSGNIAIALAKLCRADVRCDAVDVSDACLDLARHNARMHHVADKITWHNSDLFSCFEGTGVCFDHIVSNPPYIAKGLWSALPEDVRREPLPALIAGEDGLYFYRLIEKGARSYVAPGGSVFLELGDGQAAAVKKIFSAKNVWRDVRVIKDYNGCERVFIVKRKSSHG